LLRYELMWQYGENIVCNRMKSISTVTKANIAYKAKISWYYIVILLHTWRHTSIKKSQFISVYSLILTFNNELNKLYT